MNNRETEDIEIQLLLEAIYLKYGYDFRDYAKASVKRRILRRLSLSGLESFAEMLRGHGVPTQMGQFGASMLVEIDNDGPVTIVIDRD